MIRKGFAVSRRIRDVNRTGARGHALENAALAGVSASGLLAFGLPFFISGFVGRTAEIPTRSVDASLLLAVVLGGSLIVTVGELTRGPGAENVSRSIALLGALVAIDATLRLAPSFFGASPIFALIVLVGYVFGSRFGFTMGALTLLLSAAITAGVGPWLPFQMLCAGWIGVAAGWLPRWGLARANLAVVTMFGAFAGFAYGALMNLYSWPFAAPGATTDVGLYWSPSLTFMESIERYAAFYVTTSLVHDASRAAATALILLVGGAPIMRLLQRFRSRASWQSSPIGVIAPRRGE